MGHFEKLEYQCQLEHGTFATLHVDGHFEKLEYQCQLEGGTFATLQVDRAF
jgi:hypothetical protein